MNKLIAGFVVFLTVAFFPSCPSFFASKASLGIQLKYAEPNAMRSSSKAINEASSRLLLANATWAEVSISDKAGNFVSSLFQNLGISKTFIFEDIEIGMYTIAVTAYSDQARTAILFVNTKTTMIDSVANTIPIYLLPYNPLPLTESAISAISLGTISSQSYRYELANPANSLSLFNLSLTSYSHYFQDSSGVRIEDGGSGTVPAGATRDGIIYLTIYNAGVPLSYNGVGYIEEGSGITGQSVIYDSNGATSGNVPYPVEEIANSVIYNVRGNTEGLVKTGYHFAGWTTRLDGWGMSYTATTTKTMGTQPVVFHAIWIPDILISTSSGNDVIIGVSSPSGAVVIPAGVTAIASNAFNGNENITSIDLSPSVKTIGSSAFEACSSLTRITMPGVTTINDYAFIYCPITSIQVPATLALFNPRAFSACSSLITVTVDPANPNYTAVDNAIYNKALTELIFVPGGFSAPPNLPASVTAIGYWAFTYCGWLTNYTIPSQITTLRDNAFDHTGLTSISVPSTVVWMGLSVFDSCTQLVSARIYANVDTLYAGLFTGCRSLVLVEIPATVTQLQGFVFNGCTALHDLYFHSVTAPAITDDPFAGLDLTIITVHVPSGSSASYMSDNGWGDFSPLNKPIVTEVW